MKKITFILLLISLVVLSGCREREISFQREFLNVDFSTNLPEVTEETQATSYTKLIGTNTQPRGISPHIIDARTGKAFVTVFPAYQFCWKPDTEVCAAPPRFESSSWIHDLPAGSAFTFHVSETESNLPFPKSVEIYLFDSFETMQLIEVHETEPYTYSFTSVNDTITHQYLVKLIFEEPGLVGNAHYLLKIQGQ